eukprot:4188780-Karenia_brevis.AAC.1
MDRYGDAVSSFHREFYVGDPTGIDLWNAAQRRDINTTHGADGWRTPELQALPVDFWEYIAVVFRDVRIARLVPA